MPDPTGFEYSVRKNGDVVISHHGRQAAVLRKGQAQRFLSHVQTKDAQQLMARMTGNYKRGKERS